MERRWFYTLLDKKDGLYANVDIIGQLIVQWQRDGKRIFSHFSNPEELLEFILSLPVKNRCLYEIISGQNKQKPHFDLDIPTTEELGPVVLEEFLNALVKTYQPLNFESDILVFSSNGSKKWSYHVILPNHHHANNKEARKFYQQVKDNMLSTMQCYVDCAVYSSRQNFRLLHCAKYGSDRLKIWQKNITINGKNYHTECEDIFTNSLITILSQDSIHIEMEEDNIEQTTPVYENITIDIKQRKDIISLIERTCKEERLERVVDNFFILKRLRAGFCQACKRIHEHENPFVVYDSKNHAVYKFCRRQKIPTLLGYITTDVVKPPMPKRITADKLQSISNTYFAKGNSLMPKKPIVRRRFRSKRVERLINETSKDFSVFDCFNL